MNIFQSIIFAQTSVKQQGLEEACGINPANICKWIYDSTENEFLAKSLEWLTGSPLRIIIIIVAALIIGFFVRRFIRHFAQKLTSETIDNNLKGIRSSTKKYMKAISQQNNRALARTRTIASVLSSASFAVVWGIAFIMILGELNINVGPLLAGAGVAGFAIGFGAQTIVRDFLSGVFMLVEDQFGVGDIIDTGYATGTVEKVSLRTTTLRDISGTVWHIPNGEIHRVANQSQLWSRALLEIEVAYSSDLRFAEGIIQRVADEMWEDKEWGGDEILERPEVWGIQNLGADGVSIRLVVKTEPATQWAVERELRLRLKEAFDEAGVEIPFPQRTVWIRNEGEHPPVPKPSPESISTRKVSRYSKSFEEFVSEDIKEEEFSEAPIGKRRKKKSRIRRESPTPDIPTPDIKE